MGSKQPGVKLPPPDGWAAYWELEKPDVNPFRREGQSVLWQWKRKRIRVQAWGPGAFRVQITADSEFQSLPHVPDVPPKGTRAQFQVTKIQAEIRNGDARIEISAGGGVALFRKGETKPRWSCRGHDFRHTGSGLWETRLTCGADESERLYGLGQQQHGFLNQKGCVIELKQANTSVAIPFLLSNLGYGFMWNHPGVGRVELGRSATRWVSDAARQMDFIVICGDTPAEIVERSVALSGMPSEFPAWAAGFWQCKLRYRNQKELMSVAREYKRRNIPVSVIVIDFFNWTRMGEWRFDPEEWPDPAGMVRELRAMGIELMVSIWPSVTRHSENFKEMEARGLLAGTDRGIDSHSVFWDKHPDGPWNLTMVDSTNPEARRYMWEKVKEGYFKHGIRAFWLDADEPDTWIEARDMRYDLGNGAEVGLLYPTLHTRAFHDGLRESGAKDFLLLSRSAYFGTQSHAAAVWSGDIRSTFNDLRIQIKGGLNVGLCGIPWWTTDIGGFFSGDPSDKAFRELLIRWMQYGVFCPIMRIHGWRLPAKGCDSTVWGPNEIWAFGEDAYPVFKEQIQLREKLRPYLMKQMKSAAQKGTPPMRPLFYDFPEDPETWRSEDQFMFGPDLLVAPIVELGARSRAVYLPLGSKWRCAWTGQVLDGGQTIQADAPIERIPVFIRGDARIRLKE